MFSIQMSFNSREDNGVIEIRYFILYALNSVLLIGCGDMLRHVKVVQLIEFLAFPGVNCVPEANDPWIVRAAEL